jgi:polyphosphate kinase
VIHRHKGQSGNYYDKELRSLQSELCVFQDWVKYKGLRVIIVLEGRDAESNEEIIKAITDPVCPRTFRLVALPAPSDRERTQMYLQRYVPHFPAEGEVVIFDRSWYNRAIVEYVMGFCTVEQHRMFLKQCPLFERFVVSDGISLIKYWLEVGNAEQARRYRARSDDPSRHWKLSEVELRTRSHWYDYSRARDTMLAWTDIDVAPWYIVRADDKKRARLNCISHLLSLIPYRRVPEKKVKVPNRSKEAAYDDEITLLRRSFVPEKY